MVLNPAERRIAEIIDRVQQEALQAWRGYERLAIIEMVRSLDLAAFAFTLAPNRTELIEKDVDRHAMLFGAAMALRPFLEAIRDQSGGVPWGPSNPAITDLTDNHLINCGTLANIRRLAAMERYGVAKTTFLDDETLVIEVATDAAEQADREKGSWLRALLLRQNAAKETALALATPAVLERIDKYVHIVDGWFIGYDNDFDLVTYHQEIARIWFVECAEIDALPPNALLGGRRFSDWSAASIAAYGRVLHHIACATRLRATTPTLELRNLLTVFARKEDVRAVLGEAGEHEEWIEQVMSCLTLDTKNATARELDYEIPLPYYVDFGRDFVLLPMFGGLMNAAAGLVWELKNRFRRDWDKAVGGREQIFRTELRNLLPSPRYEVPLSGFRLRRPDGTELTDIDAIVIDHSTGSLALAQLKWHDVFGRSPAEWNSRRRNLLSATDWIDRVISWVDGRSAADVAATLGLGQASKTKPPELFVVARHTARFTTDQTYDDRATWVTWPDIVECATKQPDRDVIHLLARRHRGHGKRRQSSSVTTTTATHNLPGLHVEIRVNGNL